MLDSHVQSKQCHESIAAGGQLVIDNDGVALTNVQEVVPKSNRKPTKRLNPIPKSKSTRARKLPKAKTKETINIPETTNPMTMTPIENNAEDCLCQNVDEVGLSHHRCACNADVKVDYGKKGVLFPVPVQIL